MNLKHLTDNLLSGYFLELLVVALILAVAAGAYRKQEARAQVNTKCFPTDL